MKTNLTQTSFDGFLTAFNSRPTVPSLCQEVSRLVSTRPDVVSSRPLDGKARCWDLGNICYSRLRIRDEDDKADFWEVLGVKRWWRREGTLCMQTWMCRDKTMMDWKMAGNKVWGFTPRADCPMSFLLFSQFFFPQKKTNFFFWKSLNFRQFSFCPQKVLGSGKQIKKLKKQGHNFLKYTYEN